MCMTDKFWALLIEALGRPELGSDARFSSMAARAEHRDELTAILDEELEKQTAAHWVEYLGSTVPVAPVYDIEQALENPFVERVGMIQSVPHPAAPDMRLLANPLRINGERLPLAVCAPLGADNEALLAHTGGEAGAAA
jgi:crotonobetainyl-CoA:carnitine CoA-transferase CaiB-like acyl-CoA transferase